MRHSIFALILAFFAALPGTVHAQQDTSLAGDDAAFTSITDLDAAIAQASQQIDANPSDVNNYIRRGRLYFTQGDFRHSISDYSTVLQSDPNNALALFQRARAYYGKNDQDNAIADYNQFLQLRPNTVAAYINLGACYLKKDDYDNAIASENQAIQLRPGSALAYADRARAHKLKGEFDKAIGDFDQSLQADPKQPAVLCERGVIRLLKGAGTLARADFTAALQLAPNDPTALKDLAWQMATSPDEKLRDGKTAVADATKACELTQWKDAGAIDVLAAAYAESGDFDNAIKYENKYFTTNPPEDPASEARSRLALYQKKQPYHKDDEPLPPGDGESF